VTSEAGLWNVANILTIVRIVLVPVFIGFLLAGGTAWRLAALGTFCVASLTDLLDGRLARSRGLVTDFGKIADPVADKALTGAALICLSALGELPWWVTGVIMFRELGVTGLRFLGDPPGRDRGQPRRQGEDSAPDHRDLPVPAAGLAEPAGAGSRALHGGGGCGYRGDRRRLRAPGDAAPSFTTGAFRTGHRPVSVQG
jgi:Phosphatidylglycerophosphate synthase